MSRYLIAVVVVVTALSLPKISAAREPGWAPQVVKPIAERAKLQQTPIIYRPYRPLHFYGNTVRRLHYHGRVVPGPKDLGAGLRAISNAQ